MTTETPLEYAGFWIRLAAYLTDFLFIIPLVMLVQAGGRLAHLNPLVVLLIAALVIAIYRVTFWCTLGATPGKWLLGVKILPARGVGPLNVAQAIGRHLMLGISLLFMGVGYFMIAWDPKKRGLHDRAVDTVVVYTRNLDDTPRMPQLQKALLVLILVPAILFALLVAFFFSVGLYSKGHRVQLQEQGKAVKSEGRTFGQGRFAQDCVSETLRRSSRHGRFAILKSAEDSVFEEGCLATSVPSPDLCANVPPRNAYLAGAAWRQRLNRQLNADQSSPDADRLLQILQKHCLDTTIPTQKA